MSGATHQPLEAQSPVGCVLLRTFSDLNQVLNHQLANSPK
jgi:hypothetical protein